MDVAFPTKKRAPYQKKKLKMKPKYLTVTIPVWMTMAPSQKPDNPKSQGLG